MLVRDSMEGIAQGIARGIGPRRGGGRFAHKLEHSARSPHESIAPFDSNASEKDRKAIAWNDSQTR